MYRWPALLLSRRAAAMGKVKEIEGYLILNVFQVSVGGRKVSPDKDGLFDLTEKEALHLSDTYHVTEVSKTGKTRIGKGLTHSLTENQTKQGDFYTTLKEQLLNEERELLEKKASALQIKVDSKMAIGDIVAAIIDKMQAVAQIKVAPSSAPRAGRAGK
jgi:hypothetical protein